MGKESSQNARRREKENGMRWTDYVEWGIAALPFIGMSAIPVVVNLAVAGWDLPRVSWVAWALSAWLFLVSLGGIREQGRQDHTRI
jgi:hypothetical protein